MKAPLKHLMSGRSLDGSEATEAIDALLSPSADPIQSAAFLGALEAKGPTLDELTLFLNALRERANAVTIPGSVCPIDVCGTGGDQTGTFNVSTAVAFVVAGCGVAVAKHGNRSASSRCGSADVWEALGMTLHSSAEAVVSDLETTGLGFFFAPHFHPSLGHLAPIRRALGVRTVFNLLGPLANPAKVRRQLVGVSQLGQMEKVAELLKRSGSEKAWVVCGEDGMDEVTLNGPTRVLKLEGATLSADTFIPRDFGKKPTTLDSLRGGSAEDNAALLETLLRGSGPPPHRDLVEINAAAALCVAGAASSLLEGVAQANRSIESGSAFSVLKKLRRRDSV